MTSDRVDLLSLGAEVFYRRLMSIVDDFGRFDSRTGLLRVECFPLRVDRVTDVQILEWLSECECASLVFLYTVNGKGYGEVLDFKQQVRAKRSKYPGVAHGTQLPCGCVADVSKCNAHAHLDVDENPDGDGCASTRASQKSALPADFEVSERVRKWAAEKQHDRLEDHLEHFVSYVKRNGKRYVDWDEALMTAIRDNWAKLPTQERRKFI